MSKGGAELARGTGVRGEETRRKGRKSGQRDQRGTHGRVTEGWSAEGGKRGRRRAAIHIHPGVATGTLITCFNLPTADWASICHSKSVIARGSRPFSRRPVESYPLPPRVLLLLPYWCRLALSFNREPCRSCGLR